MFNDASMNAFGGTQHSNTLLATNDQISVENCHFTNCSDGNAFKFENITIRECSDVFAIVEDSNVNNSKSSIYCIVPQLTDIIFETLNIYDSLGSIWYYNYPYKASSYIY